MVKQGFPCKVAFGERLHRKREFQRAGTESARVRMGAFTQNTYNVGESLFSDIWVITGFGFNLSMVSPNYRCLCLCHNNQSKLLLIEIVTFK